MRMRRLVTEILIVGLILTFGLPAPAGWALRQRRAGEEGPIGALRPDFREETRRLVYPKAFSSLARIERQLQRWVADGALTKKKEIEVLLSEARGRLANLQGSLSDAELAVVLGILRGTGYVDELRQAGQGRIRDPEEILSLLRDLNKALELSTLKVSEVSKVISPAGMHAFAQRLEGDNPFRHHDGTIGAKLFTLVFFEADTQEAWEQALRLIQRFDREIVPLHGDPDRFLTYLAAQDKVDPFQRAVRAAFLRLPKGRLTRQLTKQQILFVPRTSLIWVGEASSITGFMLPHWTRRGYTPIVVIDPDAAHKERSYRALKTIAHEVAHAEQDPEVFISQDPLVDLISEGWQPYREAKLLEALAQNRSMGKQVHQFVNEAFDAAYQDPDFAGHVSRDRRLKGLSAEKPTALEDQLLYLTHLAGSYPAEVFLVERLFAQVGRTPVVTMYQRADDRPLLKALKRPKVFALRHLLRRLGLADETGPLTVSIATQAILQPQRFPWKGIKRLDEFITALEEALRRVDSFATAGETHRSIFLATPHIDIKLGRLASEYLQ